MNNDTHNIASNYFTLLHEANVRPPNRKELTDPHSAYLYAKEWAENRVPKLEPVILKDPESSLLYARDLMDGKRWPEAEPVILNDLPIAIEYAEYVIKDRWPLLENIILDDPVSCFNYAVSVVKNRWPEGEPAIFTEPAIKEVYAKFLSDIGYDDED